jgi:hypothetical protein
MLALASRWARKEGESVDAFELQQQELAMALLVMPAVVKELQAKTAAAASHPHLLEMLVEPTL